MSKLIKRKQIDLKLAAAPDGTYGFSSNIPNLVKGDDLETAFDKIAAVLDKLAPAMPPFLSSLSLTKSYSGGAAAGVNGLLTTDGSSITGNVIHRFVNGGTITWTSTGNPLTITGRDGHFRDGDSTTAKLRVTHTYNSTTKTALIEGINLIAVDGTAGNVDSTGYNVRVDITSKEDFYADDAASAATKSNFYKSIKAAMAATMATGVNEADALLRTIVLEYSENGTFSDTLTLTGTYRIEATTAPTATTPTLTIPTMTGNVSGVPSLAVGQQIAIASTINNGIKFYYPATIGTSTVTGSPNVSNTNLSGAQTANSAYSYSVNHTIAASQYSESIAGSLIPRDIFGVGATATATTDTTKRVDTYSLAKASTDAAIRKLSPATGGQYDAISASAYDVAAHANPLNGSDLYQYQLQLLTSTSVARYRYPTGNYTSHGGPNYTGLTGWRYADFSVGSLTNRTNCILTVVGATGIAEKFGTANFRLYIKVEGTTGWLDANAAWSAGTPSADGAAAVDAGSANTLTTGQRQITFGATVSGNISVRVGINSGSTITFTGITVA